MEYKTDAVRLLLQLHLQSFTYKLYWGAPFGGAAKEPPTKWSIHLPSSLLSLGDLFNLH